MSIKLRDLIRAVRACKTAAEERAVISKECALIRTAIKEEDEQFRHRNVAKLLFIHMLGYPTHFGQMECLKLISAQSFPEKRIGYLGLTLLLNEQTEVLTLVTNCLKLDLTNINQYIQALALIAIGNLATQDMARDLVSDVEKLLRSNNSYLRKKAALATIRLLKKEPDLMEGMDDRLIALLKDRSHGVLITGIQLVIEVINTIPTSKDEYVKLVPSLTRLLRNFLSMGYSPEHDVAGITDPFMQVKILRLLRFLGKGSEEASEQMNDVLAQVATNTETTKNAGNAILYECVQTIMEVESDSSLRVLAVNILGRFLLNRDNNIRYVALNSLSRVVHEDIAAVQRHRNTIVDCLKDPDVSIRQRALELIYQLVNEQNVVALTTELLNYLIVAQPEQKVNLVANVIQIVEKYSPNRKWRVDTVISMLSLAGSIGEESVPRTAIIFIAQAEGLQGYATHRLFRCLQEDISTLGLLQVAIWCIGEYGNLLLQSCSVNDADGSSQSYNPLTEEDVVTLLEKCSRHHSADVATKALVINSLAKLTVRFSPSTKVNIMKIITPYQHSMSLELQQRSTEYGVLLNGNFENLRRQLLENMPIVDEQALRSLHGGLDDTPTSAKMNVINGASSSSTNNNNNHHHLASSFEQASASRQLSSAGGNNSLLDLDDIFGGGSSPKKQEPAPTQQQPPLPVAPLYSNNLTTSNNPPPAATNNNNTGMDLLSMNFGAANLNQQAPLPQTTPHLTAAQELLSSGLIAPTPAAAAAPQQQLSASFIAFNKGGLQITLDVSKPNPHDLSVTKIVSRFSNQTGIGMENLLFQAAVPKYLKLEMFPPSTTTVPPNSNGAVTQDMILTNSQQGQKNLMLKLKISYRQGLITTDEIVQVSSFPPNF